MPALIFFFILLATMFLSLVAQHFIPPLPPPWFQDARVLLMPVVMFYGALALPLEGMLALAFAGGLMWDALTLPGLPAPGAEGKAHVEIAVGWSILLYAFLGAIMNGVRPLFRRGRWEVHCLLGGLLTSGIVLAEYLFLAARRIPETGWVFPTEVWPRVLGSGLAAALAAPALFFLLNAVGRLVGFNPQPGPQRVP
jgi:hypothetical protein